jgi:gluconokinase
VPAGAGGLLFLPYLLGERAPIWNADAKGVYFGLNIKHEKQHFIRATIEGILFEIYSIAKTLEEHRTITTLSINGSYACLPFWAQMIADIFNKPVSTKANSDSIGLGTFLLSATEMGVYKNLEEAAQTVTLSKPFKPRQEEHTVYKKHFDIFEKLSTKLFDEFAAISSLQVQE